MADALPCIRCGASLLSYDQAISLYMFAQTVAVSPKQKSDSERLKICPTCSVSLAMGPEPEGPVNVKVYRMLRNLIGPCDQVCDHIWRQLGSGVLVPSEVLPPAPRRLATG
jgi:hypothetical protein